MPRGVHLQENIIDKFIEIVRDNPFVYDPRHKQDVDAQRMKNFWDEIALVFQIDGMDGSAWKMKWRNFKDTYMKHNKVVKAKKRAFGVNRSYKWKFYDKMNFLDPHMPQVTSITDDSQPEDKPDVDEDDMLNGPESNSSSSEPVRRFTTKRKANEKREDNPTSYSQDDRNGSSAHSLPSGHDPDFLLFHSYAGRMKRLSPDAQAIIKMQMSQLFYNIENPHLPPVPFLSLPGHMPATCRGNPQQRQQQSRAVSPSRQPSEPITITVIEESAPRSVERSYGDDSKDFSHGNAS